MKRWIIRIVVAGTGFILCRDAAMLATTERIPDRREAATIVAQTRRP